MSVRLSILAFEERYCANNQCNERNPITARDRSEPLRPSLWSKVFEQIIGERDTGVSDAKKRSSGRIRILNENCQAFSVQSAGTGHTFGRSHLPNCFVEEFSHVARIGFEMIAASKCNQQSFVVSVKDHINIPTNRSNR